jgi:hypothetical protein
VGAELEVTDGDTNQQLCSGPDLRYQKIGEFLGRIGVELIVTVAGDQGESLAAGGHADSDAAGRVAWWGEPQLR